MAFTANNDINILQASDAAVVGAGAGNDTYVLSPSTLSANQVIEISDTQGANKLQLIGGLTIASSSVASNGVELTLSNGAKVTVLGADTFSYEVGGNPLTGVAGTVQTYAQFATTTLGAASVPAAGALPVSGSTNVTIPGGSTGGGAGQAFTLTTTTAEVKTLTAGNDTVDGSTANSISADIIVDGSTTDKDVLTAVITASPTAPTISNVETINLDFKGFGLTFDAANVSNGTINVATSQAGNTSGGTISNLSTATKGVSIVAGSGLSGITLNEATGTVGSSTSLKLDGVSAFSLTNTLDVLTINSATAANTVTIDAIGDSLAITGDKSLTLKATSAALNGEVVTKALTGGATLTAQVTGVTNTNDLSKVAADVIQISDAARAANDDLKFASGATVKVDAATTATNRLDLVSVTSSTTDSVTVIANGTVVIGNATGGAGATAADSFNTINLSASTTTAASVTLTAGTETNVVLSGATGITLANTSTAKTLVATGMTGVLTASANTATINSLTAGEGNDLITAQGTVTVAGGNGTDTLIVGNTTMTGVTFSGFEILNMLDTNASFNAAQLTGKAMSWVSVAANGTADTNGVLTVDASATANTDLSSIAVNTAQIVRVDTTTSNVASTVLGSQGIDSITGGTSADVLSGNAGNDSILGGQGSDTIDGGAGDDTISFALVASQVGDVITGGAGNDVFLMADGTANSIGGITKINDLSLSGGNGADVLKLDISTVSALQVNGANALANLRTGAGNAPVAAGNLTVTQITADNQAVTGGDILFLAGKTYANLAAVKADILTAGERTFTVGANTTQYDGFLVAYELSGGGIEIAAFQDVTGAQQSSNAFTSAVALIDLVGVSAANFTGAASSTWVAVA